MSLRREIYDLLQTLPGGSPAARIAAVGAYLDGLPADEAIIAERRVLALTLAYAAELEAGNKSTLDEFFGAVDAAERGLVQ